MSKRRIGWTMIPPYIMARTDMNDADKMVYGKIQGLVSSEGYCFATNDYLAANVLKSPDRVSHIISKLKSLGLITTEETKKKTDNWTTERRIWITGSKEASVQAHQAEVATDSNLDIATDSEYRVDIYIQEKAEKTAGLSAEREVPAFVDEVWNHYIAVTGSAEKKLSARIDKIKTRLKVFTVDELKKAISVCFSDGFYNGSTNDRGWKATADWLFKNDEHIDRFLTITPKVEKLEPGEYNIPVEGVGTFKKIVNPDGTSKVYSFLQWKLDQVSRGEIPEKWVPTNKLAAFEARLAAGEQLKSAELAELEQLRVDVPKLVAAHQEWLKGTYDAL